MKDSTNKYFVLMGMIMLGLLGFAAAVVLLFFILKLFSIAMFNIPGSAFLFELGVTVIPFFLLFGAYYLVHKKIAAARINGTAVASGILLTAGSLICISQMVLAVMWFFKMRTEWLITYMTYDKAGFALHLIVILISAGILAAGQPKEKNWMEKTR